MLKFGIFEACILVDGAELPEYSVTTDEQSKTVTCWIPSEHGKAFSVKFRNTKPYPTQLNGRLSTDGNRICSKPMRNNTCKAAIVSKVPINATTLREIVFSSIELTDDDAYLDAANVEDLGDITLEILEVHRFPSKNIHPKAINVSNGKVHERTKKATVHHIGLGSETIGKPYIRESAKAIRTLVTFTFKYRPIDILRADGIAPAESSSSELQKHKGKRKAGEAGEDDDDDDDGGRDEEDVARDEERLKTLLAEIGEIQTKLSKTTTKKKPNKRVKAESYPSIIPGEVIDLT